MNENFDQPQIMECPSCGATLAVPNADSFECDYCGKRIVVPLNLRSRKISPGNTPSANLAGESGNGDGEQASPMVIDSGLLQQRRIRHILTLAIFITLLIIGFILAIVFSFLPTSSSSSDKATKIELNITPLPTMVQFARLQMTFGSQGDQPGQFDDARSIAIDNQGNIFVADYSSGRINKFDPQGKFLQLIQVESNDANENTYIPGIAADSMGNLYVVCGGQIFKYSASNGQLLLTIPDQWPDIYYQDVIVAPDGNLYATNGMAGADDVIILSPMGQPLAHWTDMIESVNQDDPGIEMTLGASRAGPVYLLSPFGNQVYAYNPDGSFSFSFGEQGERAGQFSLSTGMLAITDKGYLVIADAYRADLFDANGNYLGKSFTIDYNIADGAIYGMTIDTSGDLYFISSGGKVLKFDMNYP